MSIISVDDHDNESFAVKLKMLASSTHSSTQSANEREKSVKVDGKKCQIAHIKQHIWKIHFSFHPESREREREIFHMYLHTDDFTIIPHTHSYIFTLLSVRTFPSVSRPAILDVSIFICVCGCGWKGVEGGCHEASQLTHSHHKINRSILPFSISFEHRKHYIRADIYREEFENGSEYLLITN